jgi:hypothetical protein
MKRRSKDRSTQRRSTSVVAGVGLLAIALCTACSNDPEDPTPSASAAPAPTRPAEPSGDVPGTDPLVQADNDLRAVVAAFDRAYRAAVAEPGNTRVVDRLLGLYVPGSQGARDMRSRMDGLARSRFAGRPGPSGYVVVEKVDVPSVVEGTRATVTVCTFDDGQIVDTAHNGPDGKPVIVNDTVESGRTRVSVLRRNGAWQLLGGDVLNTWKGVNRCPPPGRDG